VFSAFGSHKPLSGTRLAGRGEREPGRCGADRISFEGAQQDLRARLSERDDYRKNDRQRCANGFHEQFRL
jgi:hypothetical protein